MLYYIVKYLSRFGFRVFFRKINYYQQEALPKNKPIIFAVNHPTAFLDPVIAGTFFWPAVHFIVRGDVFKGKVVQKILANLKMYPIFRFRDGYSNLKNNHDTLDLIDKKLSQCKNIMILVEGETKHEKRLRPIQKGAARMAFSTYENHKELDIHIIPVGVNYTDSHQFRSEVMVEFGKAIPLKNYLDTYQENPPQAIRKLTSDLSADMRKLVIHIEDKADDSWVNFLLEINRNTYLQPLLPALNYNPQQLHREYGLVEKINALQDSEKKAIESQVLTYTELLKKHQLVDLGLARHRKIGIFQYMLLVLGLPLFLVGYILNCLPILWAVNLANKKVKKIEFHASVRYGAGLVGYVFYWLIFFIGALIFENPWIILTVLLMPLIGYFAVLYRDVFLEWKAVQNFEKLSIDLRKSLLEKREALLFL